MEKMIIELKKAKALEILNDLAKCFGWTFYKITNGDIVMIYSYQNGYSLYQHLGIFLKSGENNKQIVGYYNDKEIKDFAKEHYEKVISDIKSEIRLYIKVLYKKAI